ncbi:MULTISPECIES: WxcM-like domain-containing protein [Cyanophyceae]|uniref:WxcM-like domain-containing protein n=1 Tax=Leptolyngbya subtilissima DQ-A4 TaxID=2933933 RepID=A0ABV0KAW1_9CYAN|nr:WxcM-like domain-containing protein [Nodosilinea sp. FACHB-141]MBD2111835.1 cupin domain-containing protein [Nodosilinea sp. FACHB-141]
MPSEIKPLNINSTYVVMDGSGNAMPVSVSDTFYEELSRTFGDFKNKRLVSQLNFDRDWGTWEMHPAGEEFVCLISGQIDLILKQNGVENRLPLDTPGSYVIVPKGIWHTAKVHQPCSVLFITPGEGTQNRAV